MSDQLPGGAPAGGPGSTLSSEGPTRMETDPRDAAQLLSLRICTEMQWNDTVNGRRQNGEVREAV